MDIFYFAVDLVDWNYEENAMAEDAKPKLRVISPEVTYSKIERDILGLDEPVYAISSQSLLPKPTRSKLRKSCIPNRVSYRFGHVFLLLVTNMNTSYNYEEQLHHNLYSFAYVFRTAANMSSSDVFLS